MVRHASADPGDHALNATELSAICGVKPHIRRELVRQDLLPGRRDLGEEDAVRLVALQRLRDMAGNERGKQAWLEHQDALVERLHSKPATTWVVVDVGEGAYGSAIATTAAEVVRLVEDGRHVAVVELRRPISDALERFRQAARRTRTATNPRRGGRARRR